MDLKARSSSKEAESSVDPKSGLSFRSLQVFVAVEETGSIGAAAAQIGGSPSGVSQQISNLETVLGSKLFDRRTRPVTLTPAGQILRVHAHRILESVADARAELAELKLSNLPQLKLAVIDDLDASLTPVLVDNLQTRFSNCFVNVYSGHSDSITRRLVDREADIGVSVVLPTDSSRFQLIPLLREPFVLIVAKDMIDSKLDLREQLLSLPFVQYSETMPIGRIVAQQMKRLRFKIRNRYAFEASRSVLAMVVKAKGWALATPLNILDAERFLPDVDIMTMPFPAFSREIYLVARSGELGHLPQQLADDCRQLFRDHLLPRFSAIAPRALPPIQIMEE